MYLRRQQPQDFHLVARKIVNHSCQLPLQTGSRIEYYIREGAFVTSRRYFRQLLILDKNHPLSKTIFKSTAQMENEIRRHLNEHYYTIHPFSQARFWWEMFMILIYFAYFMIIPMQLMFYIKQHILEEARLFLVVFALTDVGLWFFTGFHDKKRQKIILRPSRIVKRYLLFHFWPDLITLLPLNYFMDYFSTSLLGQYLVLKIFLVTRIFRFGTFSSYLDLLFLKLGVIRYTAKMIKYAVFYFIIISWIVANVSLIEKTFLKKGIYKELSDTQKILRLTAFVSKGLFLVGYDQNDIKGKENSTFLGIAVIILMYLGGLLNMLILTKVAQLIYMKVSASENYKSLNKQIGEFMTYKSLPPFLRQKIRRYVKFKFKNTVLRENEIWKSLNRLLKEDILLNSCKTLINKVEFFKDLPIPVLLRIITKLRSEIYLPNDIIVLAGVTGNCMYFIYIGTVSVYTATEKEICHLSEGDHFGEIALLSYEPRTATVAAVTDCELLKLNRKDFQEAIEPFPDLKRKMKLLAAARMRNTFSLMSMPHSSII